MRLKYGDHLGPVREVHAGGGYWSQDSPVQVLTGGDGPLQVWVRWPGRKELYRRCTRRCSRSCDWDRWGK